MLYTVQSYTSCPTCRSAMFRAECVCGGAHLFEWRLSTAGPAVQATDYTGSFRLLMLRIWGGGGTATRKLSSLWRGIVCESRRCKHPLATYAMPVDTSCPWWRELDDASCHRAHLGAFSCVCAEQPCRRCWERRGRTRPSALWTFPPRLSPAGHRRMLVWIISKSI